MSALDGWDDEVHNTRYRRLHDLVTSVTRQKEHGLNLYTVLVGFSRPKKTRGAGASHQYSSTFYIIDPSDDELVDKPVCLNWFHNEFDFQHTRIGDVMRLHNVSMNYYNDMLQIVGSAGKGKLIMSRPKLDPILGCKAYRRATTGGEKLSTDVGRDDAAAPIEWVNSSSSERFDFNSFDERRIATLYTWGAELLMRKSLAHSIEGGTINDVCSLHVVKTVLMQSNEEMRLRYSQLIPQATIPTANAGQRDFISANLKCDTICMVVKWTPKATHATTGARAGGAGPGAVGGNLDSGVGLNFGSLYVWDGTTHGLTALPPVPPSARDNILTSLRMAPKYNEANTWQDVVSAAATRTARDVAVQVENEQRVLCKLHGSQVELIVRDKAMADHIKHSVRPGMWVRIRNLHIDVLPIPDCSIGGIYADTHLCPLLPFHCDVKAMCTQYWERVARYDAAQAAQQLLLQQQQQQHAAGTVAASNSATTAKSTATGAHGAETAFTSLHAPNILLNKIENGGPVVAGGVGGPTSSTEAIAASASSSSSSGGGSGNYNCNGKFSSSSSSSSAAVSAATSSTASDHAQNSSVHRPTVPISILALCVATPAPAKFYTQVTLIDWFPKNIEDFIFDSGEGDLSPEDEVEASGAAAAKKREKRKRPVDDEKSLTRHTIAFSLQVQDHTARTDIIVCGDNALLFLRDFVSSAKDLKENLEAQRAVQQHLDFLVQTKAPLGLHVMSYMSRERQRAGGISGGPAERPVRRLQVYDSQLKRTISSEGASSSSSSAGAGAADMDATPLSKRVKGDKKEASIKPSKKKSSDAKPNAKPKNEKDKKKKKKKKKKNDDIKKTNETKSDTSSNKSAAVVAAAAGGPASRLASAAAAADVLITTTSSKSKKKKRHASKISSSGIPIRNMSTRSSRRIKTKN